MGNRLWWTVSNLLFLYIAAVRNGKSARNIQLNRGRYPDLVRLTLDLAEKDALGRRARVETTLPVALEPYADLITQVSQLSTGTS